MLAVSPARGYEGAPPPDQATTDHQVVDARFDGVIDGFDFCDDDLLLDDISFDDLFDLGTEKGDEQELLPELELDPTEIFSELEVEAMDLAMVADLGDHMVPAIDQEEYISRILDQKVDVSEGEGDGGGDKQRVEITEAMSTTSSSSPEVVSRKKPPPTAAAAGRSNHATKKKAKVDWTPELHRRFVQAVEQLGVDKAVPSRILELMGIDSLTRHNVASHLQKYRSHRKHVITREAETATWAHRRPIACSGPHGSTHDKHRNPNLWHLPTIGIPPPGAPVPHFRPLHVWGHPTVDPTPMHAWPRPLVVRPPMPPWAPQSSPMTVADSAFWQHNYMRVPLPQVMTHGSPCVAMPLHPATHPPAPPAPRILPYQMLNSVAPATAASTVNCEAKNKPISCDTSPSAESIDEAIGDILAKPWSPMPLGLKPPSVDGVMAELQKQGILKVLPATAASCS